MANLRNIRDRGGNKAGLHPNNLTLQEASQLRGSRRSESLTKAVCVLMAAVPVASKTPVENFKLKGSLPIAPPPLRRAALESIGEAGSQVWDLILRQPAMTRSGEGPQKGAARRRTPQGFNRKGARTGGASSKR